MQVRSFVVLATLVLAALPATARAQVRVQGVVRTTTGAPLVGATIRITWPDLKSARTTTTDAAGHYSFDDVTAGKYVEIVAIDTGRPVAKTFVLATKWVEQVDLAAAPPSATPGTAEDLDPMEGPASELRGTIRRADGSPIAAARVVVGERLASAVTDSSGRYLFGRMRADVPLDVRVSAGGFTPARKAVTLPEGSAPDVDFTLQRGQPADTDEAQPVVSDRPDDGRSLDLRPEEVARVPAVGRHDLFRTVQFLPGATASLEASSELFVRGGTPGETLVTYDGITLYAMPHVFGALSAFNMDAVESGRLSESPFEAADGGHLSGTLRLTGRSPAVERATGSVEMSALGWGASGTVPIGTRGSFALAARRSLPTSLYDDVLDQYAAAGTKWVRGRVPSFSGGTFDASPDSWFYDLNGRLDVALSSRDRFTASVYDGRDNANSSRDIAYTVDDSVSVPDDLPNDPVVQVSDVDAWKARGMSATWSRNWSPRVSTNVVFAHSDFTSATDEAAILTSASAGGDISHLQGRGGSGGLSESNQIQETKVRVESAIRIGFGHAVTVGGEIAAIDASYGAMREVEDPSTAASRLAALLSRDDSATITSIYAQDDWRPWNRLVVSPGVRVSHVDLASATYVDPRVSASLPFQRWFRVSGGFAIDHQVANRITREDRSHGDGAFWALSDGGAIPVPRAQQGSVGATVEGPNVLFEMQVYVKSLDDLSIFAPRLFPGVAPDAGAILLHTGTGMARGAELFLRQTSGRNTLWSSLTVGRTDYRFPTLQDVTFPGSQDQSAEFKIVDAVRIGSRLTSTTAWVGGTGRPYTPATGVGAVWFPSGLALNHVEFGGKNSGRLPAYHRLDLSAEMNVRLGAVPTVFGLTVFNVYNRSNTWFREYDAVGTVLSINDALLMGRAVNASVRFVF